MTTEDLTTKIVTIGNGVTTAFPFTFPVETPLAGQLVDELIVELETIATGVIDSPLTEGGSSDYTVALNTSSEGGTVNLLISAPDDTKRIIVRRELTLDMSFNIPAVGNIQEPQLEGEFDKQARVNIQIQEQLDRAILQSIADTGANFTLPSPVAGKALGWNSAADDLENLDVSANDAAVSAAAALVSENACAADLVLTNADVVLTGLDVTASAASAAAALVSENNAAASAASQNIIKDSGEPQLKLLRGVVASSAAITAGTGFTITDNGTGDHTVNFTTTYDSLPSFVPAIDSSGGGTAIGSIVYEALSTSAARVRTFRGDTGAADDRQFSFEALGPV